MRTECEIVKEYEDIVEELKEVLENLGTDLIGEELMLF